MKLSAILMNCTSKHGDQVSEAPNSNTAQCSLYLFISQGKTWIQWKGVSWMTCIPVTLDGSPHKLWSSVFITFFFFLFPPFLTWSSFPAHQAALLYNTRGQNLSHASSEASRQPLFEPLVLTHRRGWRNTLGGRSTAHFCIHELTDAHDWLVIDRGETLWPFFFF